MKVTSIINCSEPGSYCARCGYPTKSRQCPECGNYLDSRELVISHHTRRLLAIERQHPLVAAAILILGSPYLTWIALRPSSIPRSLHRSSSLIWIVGCLLCCLAFWFSFWSFTVRFSAGAIADRIMLRTQTPVVLIYLLAPLVVLIGLACARNRPLLVLWLRSTAYNLAMLFWIHLSIVAWMTLDPLRCNYVFDIPEGFFTASIPSLESSIQRYMFGAWELAIVVYPFACFTVAIVVPLLLSARANRSPPQIPTTPAGASTESPASTSA